MTKLSLYILCMLLPAFGWSQKTDSRKLRQEWVKIQEKHGFRKASDYNGPAADAYPNPTEINETQQQQQGSANQRNQPYNGMPYSSSQQQQGRNPNGPGGNGTLQSDPQMTPMEPLDVPEVDPPDIDPPQLNVDPPSISDNFWYTIGIIILLVLVGMIVYFILRNRQPSNDTIPFEPLEENLNPATISKTELELRLEEAMAREDYRECVRIYFLFAMKELIQRRWIFWKREKTNMHYIIEMYGRPTEYQFQELVGIYELVWYGDYHIDKAAYFSMQPKLDSYYKTLESHP